MCSSINKVLPLVWLGVWLRVGPCKVLLESVRWVETLGEKLLSVEGGLVRLLLKARIPRKKFSILVLNLPRHILNIGLRLLQRLLQRLL